MGKQILKYGRILLTSVASLILAAVGVATLLTAPDEVTGRLETMMEAGV